MFTAMEKAWLRQSITTQTKALIRSKQKETPGGEIERLRNKEIDALNNLQKKVEEINATAAPETTQQKK